MNRGAWWAAVYGVAQSGTTEVTQHQQQELLPCHCKWHYSILFDG